MTANSEIDGYFDKISEGLEATVSEVQLKEQLSVGLGALRDLYRQEAIGFSDELIETLKAVRDIEMDLAEFIEIVDELPLVNDSVEAIEYQIKLNHIARSLEGLPVQQRVLRELRGLRDRLPELEKKSLEIENLAKQQRFLNLESKCEPCECGARRVIRENIHRKFWRCETYPKCLRARSVTREETVYLGS